MRYVHITYRFRNIEGQTGQGQIVAVTKQKRLTHADALTIVRERRPDYLDFDVMSFRIIKE